MVYLFINFRVDSLGCAAELLVNAWNSSLLADKGMFGSMVLVALPEKICGLPAPQERSGTRQEGFSGNLLSYEDAEVVQNALYHEFKIEVGIHNAQLWLLRSPFSPSLWLCGLQVPIKTIQGRLYARISAHVYNVMEDYIRLSQAVLDMAARSRGGSALQQ